MVAATLALNMANDELGKLVLARRFSHLRSVMMELSKVYRRIARLSKRHGANFQRHRLSGKIIFSLKLYFLVTLVLKLNIVTFVNMVTL